MLSDLFSQCVIGFDPTPEQVARFPAGRATVIERAILEASELQQEEDAEDDGSDDANPGVEDEDPAEHSVMAGPAANEQATDQLDDYTEADLVYQLHQQGYTFMTAPRLLIPEIELLMEGVDRHNRRQQEATDENGGPDAQGQAGDMQGNRGATHSDHLW